MIGQSLIDGVGASRHGVAKARGYMDSQLHWMSISPRPNHFTADQWTQFQMEYAGLHGIIDIEDMYNKWIVAPRATSEQGRAVLFPRTHYNYSEEDDERP